MSKVPEDQEPMTSAFVNGRRVFIRFYVEGRTEAHTTLGNAIRMAESLPPPPPEKVYA